jgi:hypothetical protein
MGPGYFRMGDRFTTGSVVESVRAENLGKGWGTVVVHLIGISPVAIVLTRSLSPAQADEVTALLRRMLAQAPSVADLGVETLQEDANHWLAGWEGVQVNISRDEIRVRGRSGDEVVVDADEPDQVSVQTRLQHRKTPICQLVSTSRTGVNRTLLADRIPERLEHVKQQIDQRYRLEGRVSRKATGSDTEPPRNNMGSRAPLE